MPQTKTRTTKTQTTPKASTARGSRKPATATKAPAKRTAKAAPTAKAKAKAKVTKATTAKKGASKKAPAAKAKATAAVKTSTTVLSEELNALVLEGKTAGSLDGDSLSEILGTLNPPAAQLEAFYAELQRLKIEVTGDDDVEALEISDDEVAEAFNLDGTGLYFRDIRRYKLLTKPEEQKLAREKEFYVQHKAAREADPPRPLPEVEVEIYIKDDKKKKIVGKRMAYVSAEELKLLTAAEAPIDPATEEPIERDEIVRDEKGKPAHVKHLDATDLMKLEGLVRPHVGLQPAPGC